VTFAPQPIPVFCATLCLSIQQSLLMKMSAVTWVQEVMTQVPKF